LFTVQSKKAIGSAKLDLLITYDINKLGRAFLCCNPMSNELKRIAAQALLLILFIFTE